MDHEPELLMNCLIDHIITLIFQLVAAGTGRSVILYNELYNSLQENNQAINWIIFCPNQMNFRFLVHFAYTHVNRRDSEFSCNELD